jgi:ATP-dependent Lon protease
MKNIFKKRRERITLFRGQNKREDAYKAKEIPEANRGDVEELDAEIIGDMKIVYALTMDDVLKEAII